MTNKMNQKKIDMYIEVQDMHPKISPPTTEYIGGKIKHTSDWHLIWLFVMAISLGVAFGMMLAAVLLS